MMSKLDMFGDRLCLAAAFVILGWFLYKAIF